MWLELNLQRMIGREQVVDVRSLIICRAGIAEAIKEDVSNY